VEVEEYLEYTIVSSVEEVVGRCSIGEGKSV
jgi:hypothetical protein